MSAPDANPSFVCAICEREIGMRWDGSGPVRTVPPVCRCCEGHYGPRSMLPHGSFMDRRKGAQIGALAEALAGTASRMKWSSRYARP